jgi:hypothetical protein
VTQENVQVFVHIKVRWNTVNSEKAKRGPSSFFLDCFGQAWLQRLIDAVKTCIFVPVDKKGYGNLRRWKNEACILLLGGRLALDHETTLVVFGRDTGNRLDVLLLYRLVETCQFSLYS